MEKNVAFNIGTNRGNALCEPLRSGKWKVTFTPSDPNKKKVIETKNNREEASNRATDLVTQ